MAERLEQRYLLSVDWQNPLQPADVNADGYSSAIDALVVINELNARTVTRAEGQFNSRLLSVQAPFTCEVDPSLSNNPIGRFYTQ